MVVEEEVEATIVLDDTEGTGGDAVVEDELLEEEEGVAVGDMLIELTAAGHWSGLGWAWEQ